MTTILVPRGATLGEGYSKNEQRTAIEAPGKPWSRVAGGWLDDHVQLRRFITLCTDCTPKFNPRRHEYEVWRQNQYVIGRCTACSRHDYRCRAYIHVSAHESIGDWTRGRRRGRWAS